MITLGILIGIPAVLLVAACICMIVGGIGGLAIILDIAVGIIAIGLLIRIIFDHVI